MSKGRIPYRSNILKDDVLLDIRRVAEKLRKQTLTIREYKEHGMFSRARAVRMCGSWSGAVIAAGLRGRIHPYHRGISKDQVIRDIQGTAERLGKKTLSQLEYRAHGMFRPSTAKRLCGSWYQAVIEAGLGSSIRRYISKDEVIIDIQRVAEKLGKKTLMGDEYDTHGAFGLSTPIRRFGSWRKALSAAGLAECSADSEVEIQAGDI